MNFDYLAYTKDKRLIRGNISAASAEAAIEVLTPSGLRVVSIKASRALFNMERLSDAFVAVKPKEVVMFSRQLALLLESGTDIIAALDVLHHRFPIRDLERWWVR